MKSALALVGALAASAITASSAHAVTNFDVSYEIAKPGVQSADAQNTTATFAKVGGKLAYGVETFDSRKTGVSSFKSTFGDNGVIMGRYTKTQINDADKYGGAGGDTNYAVAFPNTPYVLDLTAKVKGGVNYFGYWLSALDKGNYVTFYDHDKVVFQFRPADLIAAVQADPNANDYYGNPNSQFLGQNSGEPYAFVNFFDKGGSFTRVAFQEINNGGGYESDNHTVGHFVTEGDGKKIQLTESNKTPIPGTLPVSGVPEASTWAMMILGVGLVGATLRRRRAAGLAMA